VGPRAGLDNVERKNRTPAVRPEAIPIELSLLDHGCRWKSNASFALWLLYRQKYRTSVLVGRKVGSTHILAAAYGHDFTILNTRYAPFHL
jgi:hypothetical protein